MKTPKRGSPVCFRRNIILVIFITGVLSFTSPIPSVAETKGKDNLQPVLIIDADKQFAFAETYFLAEEYYRAIGEYDRFIYFFPNDSRTEQAMNRIAMAYFKGQRLEDAIKAYQNLVDIYSDTELATHAQFMMSECYGRLDRSTSALAVLRRLIETTDDPDIEDEAYYRAGWRYLETASWEQAQSFFGKISIKNQSKYRLKRLSVALESISSLKKKNPKQAGLLSIIPGAGYAYLGRYRDALTAFLFNGGLIWAAMTAFNDDNPAWGGVISFVGAGFYTGNIFGAVSGAHKYNRMQTGRFIEQLKANIKINLLVDRQQRGFMVAFRYAF